MAELNRALGGVLVNPTDKLDPSKLSETGKLLIEQREVVMKRWEADVRLENSRVAQLESPILIDTLPSFIDNLAEALSPEYPRGNATEDSTVAQEHGGERARVTNYRLSDLLMEYQVLREVVLSLLAEKKVTLNQQEFKVIQTSFNLAVREAATAFSLVHAEIREQFVATLTHDLRNPLNSISMATQLLQTEETLSGDARLWVSKISENAKRMDRMIQDLLDVTYVRAGGRLTLRLDEVCILDLVKEVVSQMTLSYGRKFVIEGNSELGIWDRDSLHRAIDNLASNAVKYGDPIAPITISIANEMGRLLLKVHNEGPPIPPGEREAIFLAYHRSHNNRGGKKGWGIGLPLVRAVAEAHGGSLQLDSAVGRGTTFTIDIPLNARLVLDKTKFSHN